MIIAQTDVKSLAAFKNETDFVDWLLAEQPPEVIRIFRFTDDMEYDGHWDGED